MSYSHRVSLVLLTSLVAAFVALHPYLDPLGLCGSGGCPEAQPSHAAHTGFSNLCLGAALVGSVAVASSFVPLSGGRRAADHRRPVQAFFAPDTPPPRPLPGSQATRIRWLGVS